MEVFSHFTSWIRQLDGVLYGCKSIQSKLDILQKDLEFLAEELEKLQATIEDNHKILRNHFQLAQDLRVFRITILAAVFLPLSFTTSLFGMNIESGIIEGPIGFTNFMNSTLDGTPSNLLNSTQALLSTIGSTSNWSFSWTTFAITASALLSTLPLSLFVGAAVRFIVVWAINHIVYWRAIAVVPGIAYVVLSIAGLYFDLLIPYAIFYWLFVGTNASLMAAALWGTYRGWRLNDRPLIWAALFILATITFVVELHYPWYPLTVLTWIYITIIWARPRWLQRRKK